MNKNRFLIKILIGLIFVGSITSCDDYLDVNTDPNNPTEVSPNLILPTGQVFTARYMHDDRRVNHLGNMLMYNWSEAQGFSWYDTEFQYNVTTTFYSALFDDAYTMPLKQYHLLTENEDPLYVNYAAIGWIMKSFHFQLLVDMYGDIPYEAALQRGAGTTPEYQTAANVYADLIVKLNAAIDMINNADETAIVPDADDVMFGGDMLLWKQFANSLKVRILTRMSGPSVAGERNGDLYATEMAKIAEDGTITENVVIDPGYVNENDKQNPFWETFGQDAAGANTLTNNATAATQYIIDRLNSTNDPRIDFLYEEPDNGHLGIDQGLEPGPEYAADFVSNIGPGLLIGADQGSIIFTLAENFFNLAELNLKFGDVATAEELYYAGIEASFATLGAGTSAGYIADNAGEENIDFSAATTDEERLEAIITQKWLAVNGITAEQSWFDYTRTGYPLGLPISAQALHDRRPVRLMYPASESSANPANKPAQPDPFADAGKIFWAQ